MKQVLQEFSGGIGGKRKRRGRGGEGEGREGGSKGESALPLSASTPPLRLLTPFSKPGSGRRMRYNHEMRCYPVRSFLEVLSIFW